MNKNWGMIIDGGVVQYAPDDIEYNGVFYSPATEEAYIANGYKKIVRSVPQYPPQEKYKWVKHPDQDETTIYYRWVEEQMTDAEYLIYCQDHLKDSDWITGAHAEKRMSDAKYKEWCEKRYAWWLFVHNYEGEQ